MENFIIYLLKSSGILFLFWVSFQLFLKKETFFNYHRIYFIVGIFSSILLPFWVLTKTIEKLSIPVDLLNYNISNISDTAMSKTINWWSILGVIYSIGVAFFTIRFIIQLLSLKYLISKSSLKKEAGFTIVHTNRKISPFSFFNTIVYNPELHNSEDLKTILIHEKTHVTQKHSLDILFTHLLVTFQWFNPIAWLYKKDVSQNLEYIADENSTTILKDKKAYQYLLVHQTGQNMPNTSITNQFFNSLIKKRIVMLNQKKSKQISLIKFSIIIPLLAIFLIMFNTKVVAQSESNWVVGYGVSANSIEVRVDKNSTDADLENHVNSLKSKNIDLQFSKVKRNSDNEIVAIKSNYSSKDVSSGSYSVSGKKPITPFVFSVKLNDTQDLVENISYNSVSDSNVTMSVTKTSNSSNQENVSIRLKSNEDKKPLIVIDGVVKGSDYSMYSVKPDDIASINVLKDKMATDKYGSKGESGVTEITTKSKKSTVGIEIDKQKKPLIIIDGKIKDIAIEDIDADKVKSMNVLKDKSATDKYGSKAKNGVMEIITKKE